MILKQLFIPHIVLHLFPHELVFLAKECVVLTSCSRLEKSRLVDHA